MAGDVERTSAIEGRRIEVTCHVRGEEDAEVGPGWAVAGTAAMQGTGSSRAL